MSSATGSRAGSVRISRRVAAVLVAIAAVATASCRDQSDDTNADASVTTQAAATTDAPSDASTAPVELERGVGEDTLSIGIMLPSIPEAVREIFSIDPDYTRTLYQAYIDDINARGGINGRQLVPNFEVIDYSLAGSEEDRRVCLALTEDTENFAVLVTGGYFDEVPCVATEHDTILVEGSGMLEKAYQDAPTRVFTIGSSSERGLEDFVAIMKPKLEGKKIGIMADQNPAIEGALVPALEAAGLDVAHVGLLADGAAGGAQIPLEVTEMNTSGVDAVFLGTTAPSVLGFLGEAEAQGYAPQIFASDYSATNRDTSAKLMTANFTGALASSEIANYGNGNASEDPEDLACFAITEAAGVDIKEPGSGQYTENLSVCAIMRMFEAALTKAGDTPTRDGFSAAVDQLGEIDLPLYALSTYAADKHYGGGGRVQITEFSSSCPCWVQVQDFQDIG